MLAIPDMTGLPIFEGKMDQLIEDLFLVFIDVKNIRLIQNWSDCGRFETCQAKNDNGQYPAGGASAFLLCFNECDFFMIVVNDMKGNQPSWGLCIQFGVVPVTVLLGFGVCVIMDIKGTHAICVV